MLLPRYTGGDHFPWSDPSISAASRVMVSVVFLSDMGENWT